jgi:hypothetical protein
MNCNLVFDFHSPHNNEYWYKCTTCGESDWFAHYSQPEKTDSLRTCKQKQETKMEDTDWRPSPCPLCGEMREAAKSPICRNVDCANALAKRNLKPAIKQEETIVNRPRYLWIRPNNVESPMVLIDDPVAIFRGNQFDESVDKLYQIGNEVKMKVVVEPVPSYRLGDDKMNVVDNLRKGRDWNYGGPSDVGGMK